MKTGCILLILSVICAVLLLIAWIHRKQFRVFLHKYRNWEQCVFLALAVCLLAVLVMSWWKTFSLNHSEWFFAGIKTVFLVLEGDSEQFRTDFSSIRVIPELLSGAIPLLTVFTALRLLWNYLPHHIPVGAKVWYIFSQLDGNSIRMAKDLNCDDGICIFLRTQRDKLDVDILTELQEVHHHLYPGNEAQFLRWRWRRRRILRFFFLSDNTDENFARMQDFLTDVKKHNLFVPKDISMPDGQFQQELYLLSETETAPMLIDHLRNTLLKDGVCLPVFRNTELRLLDRFRATSYDLLLKKPLHDYVQDKKLNILILGFGRIGREFFRAACSMGVLHDCETEFTICDLDICNRLNRFLSLCPELKSSVKFYGRKLDVDTAALEQQVKITDYNYILVALGEDEQNIRVASRLKQYYRLHHWEYLAKRQKSDIQPQICVNIEDAIKHSYTRHLWEDTFPGDTALYVFGGLDQVFTKEVLMPENLWAAARRIHRMLNKLPDDQKLTWNEYERRSSIACGAHTVCYSKYFGSDYDDVLSKLDRKEYARFIDTEHRRWMAYVRSEGLRQVAPDIVDIYFDKIGNKHIDTLGKLTPCLVDTATELCDLWKKLETQHPDDFRDKYTFRQRDALLIRNAGSIANTVKPCGPTDRDTQNSIS